MKASVKKQIQILKEEIANLKARETELDEIFENAIDLKAAVSLYGDEWEQIDPKIARLKTQIRNLENQSTVVDINSLNLARQNID